MNGAVWSTELGVLRVRQWIHFLPLVLAPLAPDELASGVRDGRVPLAALAAAGVLGFAYAVNAIADRHTDASAAKNPLRGQAAPSAIALRVVVAAAVFGLLAAACLSSAAVVACALGLSAGLTYSAGPRLKSRPFVGLLANTAIFVPLVVLLTPAHHAQFEAQLVTFVVLLVQNQLVHELADEREDEAAGDRTTARHLGTLGTRWTCGVLAALGVGALGVATEDRVAQCVGSATLAVATAVGVLGTNPSRARVQHRIVSVAGGAGLYLTGWS